MEKVGLERCLLQLSTAGVTVQTLATDTHLENTSFMKKDHAHIKHQFDVWHFAKAVTKRLSAKGKQKDCEHLVPWIQSISKHTWWTAQSCDGNSELLKEKWLSILHHITDVHPWTTANLFLECDHPCLSSDDRASKRWLTSGSPAYAALQSVILVTRLLKDIAKLSDFCHTGILEVYHSVLTKYCPKRQHFSYRGMVAQTQLAALDHNHNTERNQATTATGKEKRYKLVFQKPRNNELQNQFMSQIPTAILMK